MSDKEKNNFSINIDESLQKENKKLKYINDELFRINREFCLLLAESSIVWKTLSLTIQENTPKIDRIGKDLIKIEEMRYKE